MVIRMASWGPPDQFTRPSKRLGSRTARHWWRFAVKVYTTGPRIVKRPPIDGKGAASHGSKANSLRPSHSCAHGCRCACHRLRLRMLAL